ncbi:MAG: hypothetical protein AMXMBFR53_20380 [Gemmatimonadota bacterium]
MSAARLLGALAAGALLLGGGEALRRAVAAPAAVGPAAPPAAARTDALAAPRQDDAYNAPYDGKVHFVRIRYTPFGGGDSFFGRRRGGGREPMWAHDYPRGERNFAKIIRETTYVQALVDASNILTFDDPRLFQYPIAYIVEVGAWQPTEPEVEGLRAYLLKGGFLIVDDFRDQRNLDNFAFHMGRVLPGVQLIQLDGTHEIFDAFFRVDPHQVVPPYGPQTPVWYGVFEDNDREKRLLAIVNYDNDLSEYWEYSDYGYYSIDLSNEAYKLGVNYWIYALTH